MTIIIKIVTKVLIGLVKIGYFIISESSPRDQGRKTMNIITDKRDFIAGVSIEPEFITLTIKIPRRGITKSERELVTKLASEALTGILGRVFGNDNETVSARLH